MLCDIKWPLEKNNCVTRNSLHLFLRGGGKQFLKNYHFIEHAYICEFSLHKYSGVSILSILGKITKYNFVGNE